MSTRIDDLNTQNVDENIDNLKSDDNSQIVNEILQEMNSENVENNATQQTQENSNMYIDRLIDPNVNMNNIDNLNPTIVPDNNDNNNTSVYELSLKDKLIKYLKNPVIVGVLCLIIFSPILQNILGKYIPQIYGYGASKLFIWLGLIIKSLILSILYFILTQLV